LSFSSNSKREKIIEAALTLFAERGYHGTNVPDIAKMADVGTGTIYRYFKNKETLVNAVYQKYTKKLTETILLDFPSIGSTYEQYLHIMNRLISFAKENKKAFSFIETHNHADYLDESSKLIINELEAFLCAFIKEGVRQSKIRSNLTGVVLIAIVYGAFVALFKRIEAGAIQETPEIIEGFLESGWDAIKSS
jgi:TetR/AcrR family transcriptional regulator, repressor of fatR-cypB operon